MKPRTILLGIGLFIVVIFCAAMKGYYEDAEEAEHQKTLDSMKKVENIRSLDDLSTEERIRNGNYFNYDLR